MSVEKRVFVRLPGAIGCRVLELVKLADAALARSATLPPGDRTEARRFESLHAVIDQLTVGCIANDQPHEIVFPSDGDDLEGPSVYSRELPSPGLPTETPSKWVDEGSVVVELRLPHFGGITLSKGQPGQGPPEPHKRWLSSGSRGKEAVRERFEFLLEQAVTGIGNEAAIRPSGIANSILTESLRSYVDRTAAEQRIDVPVVYRDGSQGRPFPLRALSMSETVPSSKTILRFALMSIRHMELDTEVDGAWLRNTKISQSRPAALTDEIVFETSLRQINRLTKNGTVVIHMYQTGLETAIVGFYRAVVSHLLSRPSSLVVVPFFYHARGSFSPGRVWATK